VTALSGVVYKDYVQVPIERVGVLIGKEGSVKREIEETYGVELEIESSTGRVCIKLLESSNSANLLVVKNIIQAIGHGISPEKVLKAFREEDATLHVIDLRYVLGNSRNNLVRVKGRLIGERGKARKLIEELTNTAISISDHTVAIVGKLENVEVARRAIEMLISGRPHSVVWKYLYSMRRRLKRRGFILWEPRIEELQSTEGAIEGEGEGGGEEGG